MPQYVLMFLDPGTGDHWSKEELDRSNADIGKWWEALSKEGVIKGGNELQPRQTATTVRRVNGAMKVTEGPFIESKEHVGGFAMVEVADLDAAIAVAKSWPGGDVEVRPIVVH